MNVQIDQSGRDDRSPIIHALAGLDAVERARSLHCRDQAILQPYIARLIQPAGRVDDAAA